MMTEGLWGNMTQEKNGMSLSVHEQEHRWRFLVK